MYISSDLGGEPVDVSDTIIVPPCVARWPRRVPLAPLSAHLASVDGCIKTHIWTDRG